MCMLTESELVNKEAAQRARGQRPRSVLADGDMTYDSTVHIDTACALNDEQVPLQRETKEHTVSTIEAAIVLSMLVNTSDHYQDHVIPVDSVKCSQITAMVGLYDNILPIGSAHHEGVKHIHCPTQL